jgi:hypothetical protein
MPAPTPVNRLSRFVLGDNTVALDSERVLIDDLPSMIGVHGLDHVDFGKDGYLYVSIGDSGCDCAGDGGRFADNNASRDMQGLVGKILRITRDGDIPPDNPFSGQGTVRCASTGGVTPGNICQEIFASGVRNPWRITFDPNAERTRFLINDVGQDTWEEIDEGLAGADYGWNIREGYCANGSTTDCSATAPAGLTNPIFSYGRVDGCSSSPAAHSFRLGRGRKNTTAFISSVPGMIQLENFDDGHDRIAYHDDSAGNDGGMYRQTDVDIETTTDENGGFSLGWAVGRRVAELHRQCRGSGVA